MISINDYIARLPSLIPMANYSYPWELTNSLKELLEDLIGRLDENFEVKEGIAIHKSSLIEQNVTLKRPVIIMENCLIAANAYFREGVFLDNSVKIGPGCEVKNSLICSNTSLAHFNYVGNSIVGQNVNFEAGSIAANHYNEKALKQIRVKYKEAIVDTGVSKFGALIGDNSKIGANAVLSPGTLLEKNSIVKRLELVEQIRES